MSICKLSFFHPIIWVRFPYVHLTAQIFNLNNLFLFVYFLVIFNKHFFYIFLSILMVVILMVVIGRNNGELWRNLWYEQICAFPSSQYNIQDDNKFRKLWMLISQFFKRKFYRLTYLKRGGGQILLRRKGDAPVPSIFAWERETFKSQCLLSTKIKIWESQKDEKSFDFCIQETPFFLI